MPFFPDPEKPGRPVEAYVPSVLLHPIVSSSPHSGRNYAALFQKRSRLDARSLRKSEDAYVDLLLDDTRKLGIPMVAARFPRAYVDVNRARTELDPAVIDGPLPAESQINSPRVLSGLGVIPRIVAEGENIYDRPIEMAEAEQRLGHCYDRYHQILAAMLARARAEFGCALLLDFHSMPSNGGLATPPRRPDVVLGDRFGKSCEPAISRLLGDCLSAVGLGVQFNRPYAGGFITEHYGRPIENIHALQIELNRGLYLNEAAVSTSIGFAKLKAQLTMALTAFALALPEVLPIARKEGLAAE